MKHQEAKLREFEALVRLGAEVTCSASGVPSSVRVQPGNILIGWVKLSKDKPSSRTFRRVAARRAKNAPPNQVPGDWRHKSQSRRLLFEPAVGWGWITEPMGQLGFSAGLYELRNLLAILTECVRYRYTAQNVEDHRA